MAIGITAISVAIFALTQVNTFAGDLVAIAQAFCDVDMGCAKGAEEASCGETVVQKGAFGESVSSLPP